MIKLHTSSDNQYYFTVCGKNGKVILTSETYVSRKNLHRAVMKYLGMKHPLPIVDLTK